MKKGIVSLICVMCISLAAPVYALAGVYVSGKVTGVIQTHSVKGYIDVGGYKESSKLGGKDDGAVGGLAAVGYDFFEMGIPLRVELEYGIYSKTKSKESARSGSVSLSAEQDFNVQTVFMNLYYDFDTGTRLTPYIGAGAGLALIDSKGKIGVTGPGGGSFSSSHSNTNFAWNVGVGLEYALTDTISLDAGYRFVGLGKAKTGTVHLGGLSIYAKAKDLYMHQFYLGMRVNF